LFETVGRFYKPVNPAETPMPIETSTPEVTAPKADELPAIAGLDTNDGLTRVAGNRKLYLKLLRQFVEQQGPAVAEIAAALTAGDVALAERLAHTLKGVAGNIGAKSVHGVAAVLEKVIRGKAPAAEVESAKQQVAAALNQLIAGLNAGLSSPAAKPVVATPAPMVDPVKSLETAAHLSKLLSEFDPGAGDFIETNRAALQPLFHDGTWAEFEKLVQGYSFADAQAQLEQRLKTFSPA
jgi:two-component system sensor histidine kinase/response regulator